MNAPLVDVLSSSARKVASGVPVIAPSVANFSYSGHETMANVPVKPP